MLQKRIFIEQEADSWYQRNRSAIDNYQVESDIVIQQLNDYSMKPLRILEVGCSSGHRLNGLSKVFSGADLYGIDPSGKAIKEGEMKWPKLKLSKGTVDDLSVFENNYFDLVIIGFVFYVVDRELLLSSISEIDRVILGDGHLQILDFGADKFRSSRYHHIEDSRFLSYKQDYYNIFRSSGMYHMIDYRSFSHSNLKKDPSSNFDNKIGLSLMIKNSESVYK